ncbi:MAG: Maf family protein [Eubacterium sp.]|nr:Maf family protein [Eubacterium sp.]
MIQDYSEIILASKSPRRKELLGHITNRFTIVPAEGDEVHVGNTPEEIVQNLARAKASEVYSRFSDKENLLVIGADTIVVLDSVILGKPKDRDAAYDMLRSLSGRTHKVMTGVALKSSSNEKVFCEITEVEFCGISDAEIEEYIESGDPFDKAGSYGIQGDFAKYVKGIKGDYFNVVGLPVARIYQELK